MADKPYTIMVEAAAPRRMETAESSAEFVGQYVAELQDLTFNSKALINTLTMLANENKHASIGIAEAIERRILNCAPTHKLPALYLLDSIIKNVGLPYTALFARDLPEVYMSAWNSLNETHTPLQKLYNTWHRYFPADVLATISQRVSAPAEQPQASTSYGFQGSYQPSAAQASQPYPSRQAYPAQSAMEWPVQYSQLPPPPMQQQQQYNGNGYPQQPYEQQGGYGQPAYPTAYTPTYPQTQYTGSQGLGGASMPSPGHAQLPASPAYLQPQADSGATGGNAAMPDILSQLIGAGLLPPAPMASAQADRSPAIGLPSAGLPSASFDSLKSEGLVDTALRQLMQGSEASRAAFLDQRLHKQQKRAAGGSFSRQWFVRESDWLAGTTADAQATPAFFEEGEKATAGATGSSEDASVPADPSQPTCALSGERFESAWDDATNGWRYLGAAALDAEQAERYGLAEGALVKISCLGSSGGAELEGAAEALFEAEGQQAAVEVAAAASEASLTPGQAEKPGVKREASDAAGLQLETGDNKRARLIESDQ